MQKPQTTSEKVNTPPDGFVVGTDRIECCIWCYSNLQDGSPIFRWKREPRPAAGLAPRPRTTRRVLRWHKVTPRGRTASDADSAAEILQNYAMGNLLMGSDEPDGLRREITDGLQREFTHRLHSHLEPWVMLYSLHWCYIALTLL